jgi:AcrR family transcriptional regulator
VTAAGAATRIWRSIPTTAADYDADMAEGASVRRRGRPALGQSPVSEDEVLETAFDAFATYGYDGVSLRTLARSLGVSHNLLHQKYGSKRALWYAAVDHGFGPFVSTLTAEHNTPADTLERLRNFLNAFAHYSAAHPNLLRLINAEASTPSERLDYICDRFIVPVHNQLMPTYRKLVADGTLRPVSLGTLFFMITSGSGAMFSNDALTTRLFGTKALRPSNHARHAQEVADLILDGLRTSTR